MKDERSKDAFIAGYEMDAILPTTFSWVVKEFRTESG
ncbi:hypothetical protein FHU12_5378 [Serratia marcescens]|uniref:Uncharacterized protein n=1 Tax=Serratia marcescens TaxID=615 RepID=A0AA46QEF5_SERMA|nr:hypothetical protein FHU12_5378 [Serratia marcescens]